MTTAPTDQVSDGFAFGTFEADGGAFPGFVVADRVYDVRAVLPGIRQTGDLFAEWDAALDVIAAVAADYFPDGFIGLDYPSAQQLFASGMAGMFIGGSYEMATFQGLNPDIEMGVFAAPGKTADDPKLVGLYFDGGYAANAAGANKDAAIQFLNYLASPEFGQAFANTLSNISTVPGVSFDNPLLAEVNELNQSSIPYLMLAHFRYGEPSGSVLIQGEMQKLFAGETTPEAIGEALTTGLAAWYEPFQK